MKNDEQVKLLEEEIQEVINHCKSSGLNHEQLGQCAKPLLQLSGSPSIISTTNASHKVWVRKLLVFSVSVGMIAVLFQWSVSYRWICICAKCIAVKLLPYWDWTVLYNENCILYNPYVIEEKLTEDDCELYKTDKVLSNFDLCNYQTATGHRFVQVRDHNVQHFHVYWENCFTESMRAFRTYYSRPYFLPPMVELGNMNIVAMATPVEDITFGDEHYKLLSYNSTDSLTWFTQIKGQYFIKLDPRSPCDKICQTLLFKLKEGQTLVVPNDMWRFQFAPHGNTPSIALGATGTYD